MKTLKTICMLLALAAIVLPNLAGGLFSASAATTTGPLFPDVDSAKSKLCEVFYWFFTFALVIGVIMIIYAGFKYMTARGNTEAVATAHKVLLYGILGIAVVLIASAIPSLIYGFLGGDTIEPC